MQIPYIYYDATYSKAFTTNEDGEADNYFNERASVVMVVYGISEAVGRSVACYMIGRRKKFKPWFNYVYAACMLLAGAFTLLQVYVHTVTLLYLYAAGEHNLLVFILNVYVSNNCAKSTKFLIVILVV